MMEGELSLLKKARVDMKNYIHVSALRLWPRMLRLFVQNSFKGRLT